MNDIATPKWMQLLLQAVADTNITQVAKKLDVSRTTISLVLGDKYPARTDKIETRVLDVYDRITCPHSGDEITHIACRALSASSAPTSSPQAMRHWRACQTCPYKGGK